MISPLLANIYLTELDRFVEDTLKPAYQRGERRKPNPEYKRYQYLIGTAGARQDLEAVRRLRRERRRVMSVAPCDPEFRRLRYVRYADDFLLGFIGPKNEAEEIRRGLDEFLRQRLKLTLSPEKTLITHATDGVAKFLGYEISVTRKGDLITANRKRNTNGKITLRMPRTVTQKYLKRHSKGGKVHHASDLLPESDYTIVQRYQSILRGLYNYYCMAINVGTRNRMPYIKWILEQSLTKTLAHKHRCGVPDIYDRYRVEILALKALRVVLERPEKESLIATFGGFPLTRIPEGMGGHGLRPGNGMVTAPQ